MSVTFIRTSMYPPDGGLPGSVIVAEDDLAVSADKALHDLREQMPNVYIAQDVWEMPEGTSVMEATAEGIRRQKENERELNQVILYYWTVQELARVSERGMLSTTDPAPLSREDIEGVLELVVQNPAYKAQVIRVHDENGQTVVVKTQEPMGVVFEDQD